jgi:hypothetical protein
MLKNQMWSFCLARSFVVSLKGSQKQKSTKATLAIFNTISKVFYKRFDEAIAQVLTVFPSDQFRTKCLHYIVEVQGARAAQRAVSGAAAAALTGQSARVAVSKNTVSTQCKTAETPIRGNIKKQVIFNLFLPPLEEADDDNYNSE